MTEFLSTSEVDETDQKGFILKSGQEWYNEYDANDNRGVNNWSRTCKLG